MPRLGRFVASALVSLSLIGSSTAALAQTAPAPAFGDSWLTLSMLTSTGQPASTSDTLAASSAAVAAQPDSTIPPGTQTCPDGAVIPATATCGPPPGTYTGPPTPPVAVLAIWALVLGTMVYIVTKNNHSHPVPNSPA